MTDSHSVRPAVPAFHNPKLSAEERIQALLEQMTLDEKLDCMGTDPSVPRLGVRGSRHVEGLHGLSQGGPGRWGGLDPVPTTVFPQAIGLAATWEPELVRSAAEVEAKEARYYFHAPGQQRGGLVVRAPNADLGRDPRWGRTEECFGEDATLVSRMAVAFVRGLQGEHPTYWRTAALLKHFLANSNEDGREHTSSNFDERLLHEYYAAPFRAAVLEGGARAFMTAYNAVNQIPCTYHPVVRDVALQRWQQDGIVCTDAHAAGMLVTEHRTCADMVEAVTRSIKGGITQFLDDYREGLRQAVATGQLTEADLDQALRRTFRVMLRLGLLDPPELVPYANVVTEVEPWRLPETRALCRKITQKSIVLLKNEAGALPLRTGAGGVRSIALLGSLVDRVLGDWYGGTPSYAVTPLAGIAERAGANVRVEAVVNNDVSAAIAAAKRADVCIVCAGNHPTGDAEWAQVTRPSYGKEAVDRQSLELEEEALVQAVFEVNPNTVLVLISSFPYAITWSVEHLRAIVHLTHSSQELGRALADVLFGDVNPAGRLVQTWPRSLEDLPPMLDYDLTHGRTYMYSQSVALFPFGFGLSYTTFEYRKMLVVLNTLRSGTPQGELKVHVDVVNTGERDGDEVLQLYASFVDSAVKRPERMLVDFRRTAIQRGLTKRVELCVTAAQLAVWSETRQEFVLEPGRVVLSAGGSSAQLAVRAEVGVA